MNKSHILPTKNRKHETMGSLNRQNRSKQLDLPTIYSTGLNGGI